MGKGAALHRGIKEATGDFVIIQDADLEYDPAEYTVTAGAADRRQRRRGLRLALSFRASASRALFLAFGWQLDSYAALERSHQHQPQRYGNLLQSVPARGHPIDPPGRKTFWIRAGNHGEDRQAEVCASTKSASATGAARMKRARKSVEGWGARPLVPAEVLHHRTRSGTPGSSVPRCDPAFGSRSAGQG